MKNVKVSIIIPAYNVERYLKTCLDSVVNQSLEDIEIIIIDDGSTDSTLEICNEYKNRYGNIIVIGQEHQGQGSARNKGLKIATGKYIGFVDADDYIESSMFEMLYNCSEKCGTNISVCDIYKKFVLEDRIVAQRCMKTNEQIINTVDYIKKGWNITFSWNKLYRRKIWEGRRFSHKAFEDVELIPLLLCEEDTIGYVTEPLYYYCKREGATTTTEGNPIFLDVIDSYRKLLNSECCIHEELEYFIAKCILNNLQQSISKCFRAEFLDFAEEIAGKFRSNRLIEQDVETRKLLDNDYRRHIPANIYIHTNVYSNEEISGIRFLHPLVRIQLFESKNINENSGLDYSIIKEVHASGGVVIFQKVDIKIPIGKLRALKNFVIFSSNNDTCGIVMAGFEKRNDILDTYLKRCERGEHIDFSKYLYRMQNQSSEMEYFDMQVMD